MLNMSIKVSKMSFHDIHLNLHKSQGSYVFDDNTDRSYLDFFGMYASLPLGYNHEVFDEEFHREMREVSTLKVTNCEFDSDIKDRFVQNFYEFAGDDRYNQFHFTCTGSLAVECACKLTLDSTGKDVIVSLANSFHGIHGYGNFTTSKFCPVKSRLDGFPDLQWPKVHNISELEFQISKGNVGGILVEPIQATFGDNHLDKSYLRQIADIANVNKIPLIFDEIQTGFGTTGKPWYYQHTDVVPDMVVFGKKSQVCGVMTTPNIPFEENGVNKLSVTFDGDLVDMLRSIYIMKAYKKNNLLKNAERQGKRIIKELSKNKSLEKTRGVGLLIAFDLSSREHRDNFVAKLRESGMICNPTGEKSVRLRPNLSVTDKEVEHALKIIRRTSQEI